MCKDLSSVYDSMIADGFLPEPGTALANIHHIVTQAKASDNGERCMIAPHPDLRDTMKKDLDKLRGTKNLAAATTLHNVELPVPGFNDGVIFPPEDYPLGTPLSVIKSGAADKAPLRGTVRVIVVLVDFTDKHMTQTVAHFNNLFFSSGGATKSVRDYYNEVTQGLVDIQGQVVGPFRMPQTLATYAHGASGTGGATPNAQTMARDALIAADPTVNFSPFDNDGNGFVDAFIVIHAGSGAEVTGNTGDIWSHKWTLDGGARTVDGTKVFGYLTVPEDSQIGVCCHELGHLLFGFPDLYDTDFSSEGIGNWCLMAAGSWGGTPQGSRPVHPSAWCKANQGWAAVNVRTTNGVMNIPDVKDPSPTVHRLWKDGGPGQEYFLMENRQQTGFDASLPGPGLLIWHIDEAITSNRDENHAKVALMQADGLRELEHNLGRGNAGDPYPGSTNNTSFSNSSNPNSKSYAGVSTCVSVTGISPSAHIMSANVQVRCIKIKDIKDKEIHKDIIKDKDKEFKKDLIKDKELHKDLIKDFDKSIINDKLPKEKVEKPIVEKGGKELVENKFADKISEKLTEGGLPGGLGGGGGLGFGNSAGGDDAAKPKEKDIEKVQKDKDIEKLDKELDNKFFKEKEINIDKMPKEKDKDKEFKEFKEKDFKEKEFKEYKEKEKEFKEHKDGKEIKEGKEVKEHHKEVAKEIEKVQKDFEKSQFEKNVVHDKNPIEKRIDEKGGKELVEKDGENKLSEGKLAEGGGGGLGGGHTASLEARIAYLEQIIAAGGGNASPTPFIGSDLRPDLTGGAFSGEEDQGNPMGQGGHAGNKRQYDTKQSDR